MSNWLTSLFPYKKLRTLQEENEDLKAKILEKQEVINRTNAYWKREIHKKAARQGSQKAL